MLYVLGCAHSEAGRLLGLLRLPNDTTMMIQSLGRMEERIGSFIRELGEEIILEKMEEEAWLSIMKYNAHCNIWKLWKAGQYNESMSPFPVDCMPQIDVLYDMT